MEQTMQQIERFLKKIAQKFPSTQEPIVMTDIHLRVSQFSGDLMAFDDEGNEITRCVVEEWIETIMTISIKTLQHSCVASL